MKGPTTTVRWDDLARRAGAEIGVSEWIRIDQPMIDRFAALTGDEHPIHVDPAHAAALPLGRTIAHGFLTLSLLSRMSYEVCPAIEGARFPLNYGFDRVRFVAPVPVGSRVRAHFVLKRADEVAPAQRQLVYDVRVEIEGVEKPALVAEWLARMVM